MGVWLLLLANNGAHIAAANQRAALCLASPAVERL